VKVYRPEQIVDMVKFKTKLYLLLGFKNVHVITKANIDWIIKEIIVKLKLCDKIVVDDVIVRETVNHVLKSKGIEELL
jgi:hypothetical protein